MSLEFHLQSPTLLAAGLADWASATAVLRGQRAYASAPLAEYVPDILPPTAQRRASASTLLAVRVAHACLEAASIPFDQVSAVFTASSTDTAITDAICRDLTQERPMLSPIQFHNSVHNAPAGYWSIATGARTPTTSLAAHDGSFAAGLLSAAVQMQAERRPVLLVAYELPYPDPLDAARPLGAPFATAMLLTAEPNPASLLRCQVGLRPDPQASRCEDPQLDVLRQSNPAARALPLLIRLAAPDHEDLRLPYLDDTDLLLSCRPC